MLRADSVATSDVERRRKKLPIEKAKGNGAAEAVAEPSPAALRALRRRTAAICPCDGGCERAAKKARLLKGATKGPTAAAAVADRLRRWVVLTPPPAAAVAAAEVRRQYV